MNDLSSFKKVGVAAIAAAVIIASIGMNIMSNASEQTVMLDRPWF